MFQFSTQEQNAQITLYSGICTQFPTFQSTQSMQSQRTLEALRIQTNYLVSEINGIKQVLGEFMTDMRQRMNHLTDNVSILQRNSDHQKPRKKFKKAICCPHDDCQRKYSSKIALNCHIRTKHSRKHDRPSL